MLQKFQHRITVNFKHIAPVLIAFCVFAGVIATVSAQYRPSEPARPEGNNVWTAAPFGNSNSDPIIVATAPNNPAIVFAANLNSTFTQTLRSTNYGQLFEYAGGGTGVTDYNGLMVAPSDANYIYTTGGNDLYYSSNGGTAWMQTGLANSFEGTAFTRHAVAVDPVSATTVLVGTTKTSNSARVLYRKAANSFGYAATNLTASAVRSIAFAPSNHNIVYAGTSDTNVSGVYKSADNGATWTAATDFAGHKIIGLAVDPTDANIIYAGATSADGVTGGGIWKSANGGTSWTNLNPAWNGLNVVAIIIDPQHPATIYAGGTIGGVQKSANGGATWTAFNDGSAFTTIASLAIDSSGRYLYAGVNGSIISYKYVSNRRQFDFDGDGLSDVAVFRPSTQYWYTSTNPATNYGGVRFGEASDKLVPADYDGDGKTDVAVYHNGLWYLLRSQAGVTGITFGLQTDIPVPADYDGDGKADLAVFRPSNGTWYVQGSTAGFYGAQFGLNGDKPVPADYDGDGKADLAVNRSGNWYIQRSQLGFTGFGFGLSDDKLVPADYDGDGKTDVAVFRPSNGTWYLQRSQAGFIGINFGLGTDLPTPADYDGDGKTDIAVFRSGTWYLNRSTAGYTGVSFGVSGDTPIENVYVR